MHNGQYNGRSSGSSRQSSLTRHALGVVLCRYPLEKQTAGRRTSPHRKGHHLPNRNMTFGVPAVTFPVCVTPWNSQMENLWKFSICGCSFFFGRGRFLASKNLETQASTYPSSQVGPGRGVQLVTGWRFGCLELGVSCCLVLRPLPSLRIQGLSYLKTCQSPSERLWLWFHQFNGINWRFVFEHCPGWGYFSNPFQSVCSS